MTPRPPTHTVGRPDADDLRALRKRLLIAESMLMRERLARGLGQATRPMRMLTRSLGAASASVPLRPLLWTVLPWLIGRWRGKRPPHSGDIA